MDLWKRKTALFLAGQTISLLGSVLVQYAITWHITLTTQSGVMMTVSIICGFLPTFFISPFAGVWADRFSRKTLIILADSFIAIATLILAILFFKGYNFLWLLFLMSAIRALGSGVQSPAIGAFLPQLAPRDMLTRVNAINNSIHATVTLVSPMLSGALLSFARLETIFFIDVITAAMAVSILLFLQVPVHAKAEAKQVTGYFRDMQEGIAYVLGNDFIKVYCLFSIFFLILVAPAACLTPLQVARTYGDDVWRLTAIEVAFSLGMIGGGVLMAAWGGFKNKLHSMTLSNLIIAACTFALGLAPAFWLYLVLMGVFGVAMPIFNTPATVLVQQKVEGDFLGRVFGVIGMISSTMLPLGMLVFGPMADFVHIELLLVATGILLFILSVIMGVNKVLYEAGKPEPLRQ
ncbi:MAG: MFS transporter [Bacillota bacterium]|jgi:DHA3 family macrolide efflux protein-like MFS transporter